LTGQSFTAEAAKGAKEEKSLTAKDAKNAKATIISFTPQERQDTAKWGIQYRIGLPIPEPPTASCPDFVPVVPRWALPVCHSWRILWDLCFWK
jgi:hypothetical protein